VPGVDSSTPRGLLALKKLPGKLFGAEEMLGTPSQLISRRPLPKDPTTFGFSAPSEARKAVTVP
jgi:hypothetical protein